MELEAVVSALADIPQAFDTEAPVHKHFQAGIAPFGEPQLVGIIAQRLSAQGHAAKTQRTPDLRISEEWALEFKIVRPFGDNGKEAEDWSVNMLHPYAGNVSLLGDAVKLRGLDGFLHKGLVVLGFEHQLSRISLDPLLDSFESIASRVMHIALTPRIEQKRGPLVHPEHQMLRCIGWELAR